MRVLLTGGAGYIGSHVAVELQQLGHEVIIVDNFTNSARGIENRVEQITQVSPEIHDLDVADRSQLEDLFSVARIDSVIHLAGHKAVAESVRNPLKYYRNNLSTTMTLLETMMAHGVGRLVFSSSATVYEEPTLPPITELSPVGLALTNPYGRTKAIIEGLLHDLAASDPTFEISILRYFNPVGAHQSGLIGENPTGTPNNLLPIVGQVAAGRRDRVSVFGDQFDTPDGTGVRDYIHVVDLALGHVAALNRLRPGAHSYNLGTGRGHSVLDVIGTYGRVIGREIPYAVEEARVGDVATSFADVTKAQRELAWRATRSLEDSCRDAWRWQSQIVSDEERS